MGSSQYKVSFGDGAYGPGDIEGITVLDEGTIAGPQLPNWQAEYILARCVSPNSYRGQELKYVVLSPRYANVNLTDIRRGGAVVAVGRILGEKKPEQLEPNQVQYWAVGVMSLIES
jgi:hypothetical protein